MLYFGKDIRSFESVEDFPHPLDDPVRGYARMSFGFRGQLMIVGLTSIGVISTLAANLIRESVV